MTAILDELKYTVETKDGPICGYVDKTEDGSYYKFKSIPYAEKPIGSLRFMPPSPVQPWKEVLDCTKDAPLCITHYLDECTLKDFKSTGSEDCLYIELSTPSIKPNKPMPVMFWIGGFGYAVVMDHLHDPTLINEQDIVFVRCGYRTGPFGFLSINEYTAPGNCGLKDIVLALKWVQRNISSFGGDPSNVTIFGSSTGGALVSFMMLSPMATGLFHKAVMQSATALNNWSLAKNPLLAVIELAKEFGIKKSSKAEIVEELRSIPESDIIDAFFVLKKRSASKGAHKEIFDAVFKPCIEVDLEGQPAFLTKSPLVVLKSGNFNKVPCIIGNNNIEGAVLQLVIQDFYSDFEKYNENVSLLVPRELTREDKLSENIGHQLLKFYLGGEDHLRADTRTQYLQLISDYYFSYYVNKTVRLLSEQAPMCPIYYYILNFVGQWAVPKTLDIFNSPGHVGDIALLFRIKMPEICKGSRDSVSARSKVIKMWTNFAKTGNPTPDDDDPLLSITWDPVENKDRLNYLCIGPELTKGRNPFHDRMQFWDALHKEHAILRALVYYNDIGCSY